MFYITMQIEVFIMDLIDAKNIKENKVYEDLLIKISFIFSIENAKIRDCDIALYKKAAEKIAEDAVVKIKGSNIFGFMAYAKMHVANFMSYSSYLLGKDGENQAKDIYCESKGNLETVLGRLAASEAFLYLGYKNENKNIPDVNEILSNKDNALLLSEYHIIDLYENIYLPQYTQKKIMEMVSIAPKDEYPLAREMKRHFTIHVGGTNTGKTYNSINALKGVDKGVYLSPLRLLAMEVQDTLNSAGVLCNLSTGEEEDIIPGAKHMSSTVEKLDTDENYDLCVIDECQMIADSQRGCHWTRAILGVRAENIHLCTAPESLEILKRIIRDCNDTFEVIEHHRTSELTFLFDDYKLKNAERGDALVVFSRKSVLAVASELTNLGLSASVIYGALPYAARKKQLERFLNKETDIVVATDAIGMGLNLPIRRVIFFETEKFDGSVMRPLNPAEIKQIAGRAGRKGIYDEGFVLALQNKVKINDGLKEPPRDIFNAYLGFSDELASINAPLVEILKIWKSIIPQRPYTKTDISRMILLCEQLEENDIHLNKNVLLKVTSIPFDEKNIEVSELWLDYCKKIELREAPKPICKSKKLEGYESYYKCIDLYYTFSKNMRYEIDMEWIKKEKESISEAIDAILVESIEHQHKKCSRCGKKLSWNYKYGVCEDCYSEQFY